MTPKFPIISFYNNAVELIADETFLTRATVLGILKGKNHSLAYDSRGNKWKYELRSTKIKDNLMTKLLSKTIYNPSINVEPLWSSKGKYRIQELKNILIAHIDKDDDILTQFVGAEKLRQAIQNAKLFDEICTVLNKYIFEVNEEQIWNKDDL